MPCLGLTSLHATEEAVNNIQFEFCVNALSRAHVSAQQKQIWDRQIQKGVNALSRAHVSAQLLTAKRSPW